MKTKEELNALKKEVESLNKKLAELTEEELAQVVGGTTELSKPLYSVGDWVWPIMSPAREFLSEIGFCITGVPGPDQYTITKFTCALNGGIRFCSTHPSPMSSAEFTPKEPPAWAEQAMDYFLKNNEKNAGL